MLKDLRHGIRVLLQAKGWTAVVVLSLAVGIGANTAIFTALNGMMLRKLPVRDPDGLARFRWAGENDMLDNASDYGMATLPTGERAHATFSYPMFEQLKSANQTLTDLAASRPTGGAIVTIDGRAETASALLTTGNYYEMLGVDARIGRTLTAEDDRPSAPPVAMLSHGYWQSRFGATTAVIGKSIRVNSVPVTIVGVAPQDFTGTQFVDGQLQDVLLPLKLDDQLSSDPPRLNDATNWWVQVIGRLKPGIRLEQVRGNLEGVFQSQARAGMESHLASLPAAERAMTRNQDQHRSAVPQFFVESGSRGVYDIAARHVRSLEILARVVGLVLLLVCANVANLLLSRVAARQKEISIRLSIGATRARLVRQLLTESLLLSALGGTAGFFIARWGQALLPEPIGTAAPPDWRVVAFTAAVTALAGVVFGIAPALRGTRMEVGTALKESSRSVAGNSALSRGLLVLQVSISLVLLVGAGLFLRTLHNLRSVDIGWNPHNLVFVRVNAEGGQFDNERKFRFFQEGMDRLRAIPGVRHATVSKPTLMSGGVFGTAMYVQGRVYPKGKDSYVQERDDINRVVVAPNYFEAMGIPLVAGRGFTDRDHEKAPEVAVINQAAARKFFQNENPIGRKFGTSIDDDPNTEVVGVLRDVRYNDLREEPPATMYIPHRQSNPEDLVFSVRTLGDPSSVMSAAREAIAAVDPRVPVVTVQTQMSTLEQRYAQEKVLAQAYTLFGSIALFVAAIGLFGLMSYNVSRRTREIGIRMALGAERREVLGLVLRESMLLVAIGVVIGVAASLAAGRLVASQLFGLEPTDLPTMAAAMFVMLAVSAAAGYLPARRAARVDPMIALRYE